jgi:hypothetical protein
VQALKTLLCNKHSVKYKVDLAGTTLLAELGHWRAAAINLKPLSSSQMAAVQHNPLAGRTLGIDVHRNRDGLRRLRRATPATRALSPGRVSSRALAGFH